MACAKSAMRVVSTCLWFMCTAPPVITYFVCTEWAVLCLNVISFHCQITMEG